VTSDRVAAGLRGFGPLGILAFLAIAAGNLVVAPLSAFLVLVWARLSRTPWRDIGYVRPKSWTRDLALGIVFGTAFKLLMKTIVMPVLGADPINRTYHYLAGNRAALPGILFAGYLFERLRKLLGSGVWARSFIVLLTATLFGLAHYPDQGLAGAEQGTITGLVFGTIFAVTGQLWMLMCAHAAFDVTAVAIIYWDLESAVAHLVFKQAA